MKFLGESVLISLLLRILIFDSNMSVDGKVSSGRRENLYKNMLIHQEEATKSSSQSNSDRQYIKNVTKMDTMHSSSPRWNKNEVYSINDKTSEKFEQDVDQQSGVDVMKFLSWNKNRPSPKVVNASRYLKSLDGFDWDCYLSYQTIKQKNKSARKDYQPIFCVCTKILKCLKRVIHLTEDHLGFYKTANKKFLKIDRGADFQCEVALKTDHDLSYSCKIKKRKIVRSQGAPATHDGEIEYYCDCIPSECLQNRQRILVC